MDAWIIHNVALGTKFGVNMLGKPIQFISTKSLYETDYHAPKKEHTMRILQLPKMNYMNSVIMFCIHFIM